MDSGSGDDSPVVQRKPKKNIYRLAVVDSDTESNTSNQSSNGSAASTPAKKEEKKKMQRKTLGSDSDSNDDSDNAEASESDTKSEISDGENETTSPADRSSRQNESVTDIVAAEMAKLALRHKDSVDETVIPESDEEEENSVVSSQGESQGKSQSESRSYSEEAPVLEASINSNDSEQEEAEQEEQRQCFSPRTRRSISGLRPKGVLMSDESDDESSSIHSNDGEQEKAEQEEQRQCFSPRTRRSISGLRPKGVLTSDESDDESSDGGENYEEEVVPESPELPVHRYNESVDQYLDRLVFNPNIERKKLFQSVAGNEATTSTPLTKYPVGQSPLAAASHDSTTAEHNTTEHSLSANASSSILQLNNSSYVSCAKGYNSMPQLAQLINKDSPAYSSHEVSAIASTSNVSKSHLQLDGTGDASDISNVAQAIVEEDSQELHTIVDLSKSANSSSVVLIDSDDDDVIRLPDRRLTKDFKLCMPDASTPHPNGLVQPKIEGAIRKMSTVDKKGVSQEYYDKNVEKLAAIVAELKQNRDLLARLGHTLHDKGQNLKHRIAKLEAEVQQKQIYISSLIIEEEIPISQAGAAAPPKPISWAELEKGTNAVQPKFTGVVGSTNFAAERDAVLKSLKSAHLEMETCPSEDTLAPTPSGLKISLMPHQQYALAWMLWREKQKHPCGGILADDMGLGKTLSIIALVLASDEPENTKEDESSEEESDGDVEEVKANNKWAAKGRKADHYFGGTLVICPASLINQWEKEVENRVKRKHCSVRMHHGNSRETSARLLSKYDMVITTYGVITSEWKSRGPLFKIHWERIVLDEAHIIRNHTTAMAQSCCELKGKRRWGLTGTPIQNKEMDLFSLWKFLKVRGFDDLTKFKKWINLTTIDGKNRLNARLRPMLLRRTKAELQIKGELQGLPEKEIEIIMFSLNTDEMNVYSKILTLSKALFAQFMRQRAQRDMQGFGSKKDNVFSKLHAKFKQMQGATEEVKSSQILVLLTRLRQICDHPGLIDAMLQDEDVDASDSEDEQQELDLLAQINNLDLNEDNELNNNSNTGEDKYVSKASSKVLLRSNPVFDFDRESSKFKKVLEVIQNIQAEGDDKIVVVSQWTSVLNILAKFLNRKRVNFCELTGKTAIKLRNDIVVNFNKPMTPQRVMLLSLVAGGVGLNLTGANHLILVDPHWNPQLEAQAFDRVYRVGQTKPVKIYKLLSEHTVEMGIKHIQDQKLDMAANILTGSKNNSGSKLSFQDLCSLFQM